MNKDGLLWVPDKTLIGPHPLIGRRSFLAKLATIGVATVLKSRAANIAGLLGASPLDPEVRVWRDGVIALGGGFEANSIAIAQNFFSHFLATGFDAKVKYILPLLGTGIAAARMPLRDTLGVGAAANTGFVDGDFSQATGLKGNGTSKLFDLLIKPNQIGNSNDNGGLGYWENNIDFGGTGEVPLGVYRNSATGGVRYDLDLRNTISQFIWGNFGGGGGFATNASAAVNAHYYGQSGSTTSQELFINGSSVATGSGIAANRDNSGDANIRLMGCLTTNVPSDTFVYWKGRCAVAYMTDGSLTSGNISAFHTLLQTYLITPTGR